MMSYVIALLVGMFAAGFVTGVIADIVFVYRPEVD